MTPEALVAAAVGEAEDKWARRYGGVAWGLRDTPARRKFVNRFVTEKLQRDVDVTACEWIAWGGRERAAATDLAHQALMLWRTDHPVEPNVTESP